MLDIYVIDNEKALEEIQPRWQRLAIESTCTPFQTAEWNLAWWMHVGSRNPMLRLHVVLVFNGDNLVAIAPLMIEHVNGTRVLKFLTTPYADYHDVILETCEADRFCKHLFLYVLSGIPKLWERVELREIPNDSPILGYLQNAVHLLGQVVLTPGSRCPILDLHDERAFSRAVGKKEYIIKQRRLSRLGDLECKYHFGTAEILERMPSYMTMHLHQWLPRPNRGITFDDPTIVRFYNEAILTLAPSGLLMLTELVLNRQPVAYYYGFVYKHTYWGYRPAFETEYAKFSPGHVMHRYMFYYLKENSYLHFDFMRGEFGYKYMYANRESQNTDVLIQ